MTIDRPDFTGDGTVAETTAKPEIEHDKSGRRAMADWSDGPAPPQPAEDHIPESLRFTKEEGEAQIAEIEAEHELTHEQWQAKMRAQHGLSDPDTPEAAAEWMTVDQLPQELKDEWGEHAQNVIIKPSEENKSALYENFLPMINTGGVILLDDMRAVLQIANLERRARFGGREPTIDHPPRGHDDRSNVIAGVAVHAQRGKPMAGSYAGARDHNPPKVLIGYEAAKRMAHKAGRTVTPNRSKGNGMSLKHEIAAADVVQTKREPIGNQGHEIAHTSTGGDGRKKYTYWGPGDVELGSVFGKENAVDYVHQLIKTGTISR